MNATAPTADHPDDEALRAYLAAPDAPRFRPFALHLAGCAECRHQLDLQTRLQAAAGDLPEEVLDEAQQQIVDDFVYAAPNQRSDQARAQIRAQPMLLKSALHSLAQAGERAQQPDAARPARRFAAVAEWMRTLHANWMTIPATALATLMLTLLVLQWMPPQAELSEVVAYQDDASIRFFPASQMPGIGFFSAARQRSQDFPAIRIEQTAAGKLTLSWPPVEQAQNYRLTLHGLRQGKKILLKSIDSNTTSASITLQDARPGQRYVWTLSGKTAADERFVTSGGFVLRNRDENL